MKEASSNTSLPEELTDPTTSDTSLCFLIMATWRSQTQLMQPALDKACTLVRRFSLSSWPKKSQSLDSATSSTSSEVAVTDVENIDVTEVSKSKPKRKSSFTDRGTEPPWTNTEVEKFWIVLEPHISKLVYGTSRLPATDVNWDVLDRLSASHLDLCLLHVQELLWSGRYSLGLADLREAVKLFKDCRSAARLSLGKKENELKTVKEIFLKKIPSRRRLWTAYRSHSF